MKHPDLIKWFEMYGRDLTIGTEVFIDASCKYHDPRYDVGIKYLVTALCVDSTGLNISLNLDGVPLGKKMHDKFSQDADGYRITDLKPVNE